MQKVMKIVQATSGLTKVYHQLFELEIMASSVKISSSPAQNSSTTPFHTVQSDEIAPLIKPKVLPVFVQLIHDTVNDQLSLLLLPNFAEFLEKEALLLSHIMEILLDDDLSSNDANYALIANRRIKMSQAILVNTQSVFAQPEFRTLLVNILFNQF